MLRSHFVNRPRIRTCFFCLVTPASLVFFLQRTEFSDHGTPHGLTGQTRIKRTGPEPKQVCALHIPEVNARTLSPACNRQWREWHCVVCLPCSTSSPFMMSCSLHNYIKLTVDLAICLCDIFTVCVSRRNVCGMSRLDALCVFATQPWSSVVLEWCAIL